MAYATGCDLVDCYDIELVGDLAQDSREETDQCDVTKLPIVAKILDQASGVIDSALIAGGRYRAEQLLALEGIHLAFLKRMVCTVAMSMLLKRRVDPSYMEMAKLLQEEVDGYLKSLRTGENLFDIAENKSASVIELQTVQAVEIDTLNLLPSRMGNYFPGSQSRVSRY